MNSKKTIQLQRLVDGELKFPEVQQLLRDAEIHPETWREIASAYVENQIWQSEFVDENEIAAKFVGHSIIRFRGSNTVGPIGSLWWMSLAASALLALSLGFLMGDNKSMPPVGVAKVGSSPGILTADFAPELPSQTVARNRFLDGDDLNANPAVYHRMQLEDESGNRYLDSDVPLYTANQSNTEKWLRDSQIPASVAQQVADSGYQLQQNIRYLSGKFKDGRKFVIPVRNYSFSPVH